MDIKIILLFIFFSNFLFPAKIGFINANGADCVRPIEIKQVFEKYGHTIEATSYKFANKYTLLISQNQLAPNSKVAKKTILICMEPKIFCKELYDKKITDKYACVFTFDHNLCKGNKYEKMFYPSLYKDVFDLSDDFIPFTDRKLACLLNSIIEIDSPEENYSKRVAVAKFYDENFPNELILYGIRGWEKYKLSIYRGFCSWHDQDRLFKEHKFCFCYENWENDAHYISEKILICFQNQCVPVYKGCTRITEYIPKETFINANDFNSIAEIHEFISKMDEETWMAYINAIRKFISSDESTVFTNQSHAQRLLMSVNQVLKRKNLLSK